MSPKLEVDRVCFKGLSGDNVTHGLFLLSESVMSEMTRVSPSSTLCPFCAVALWNSGKFQSKDDSLHPEFTEE